MALLTTYKASHNSKAVPVLVAANSGGDTFQNDGRTVFIVNNGSGSAITVTFDSLVDSNQGVDTDAVISVANGERAYIGPFNPNRFNDSGEVSVTYSGVTTVTVGVLRLENPG